MFSGPSLQNITKRTNKINSVDKTQAFGRHIYGSNRKLSLLRHILLIVDNIAMFFCQWELEKLGRMQKLKTSALSTVVLMSTCDQRYI